MTVQECIDMANIIEPKPLYGKVQERLESSLGKMDITNEMRMLKPMKFSLLEKILIISADKLGEYNENLINTLVLGRQNNLLNYEQLHKILRQFNKGEYIIKSVFDFEGLNSSIGLKIIKEIGSEAKKALDKENKYLSFFQPIEGEYFRIGLTKDYCIEYTDDREVKILMTKDSLNESISKQFKYTGKDTAPISIDSNKVTRKAIEILNLDLDLSKCGFILIDQSLVSLEVRLDLKSFFKEYKI